MLVKNIIKKSAEFLNLNNVKKYLDNELEITDEIESDINTFLLSVNMVNNTIASSYIELISDVEIDVSDGLIPYSEISDKSIIEIKSVTTTGGEKIDYKLYPEGVKIDEFSKVKIEYTYFPSEVTIDDEIDYFLKVNEITFAMGVVGEYLYIKGAIDDASVWDKRFKQSLFNVIRPKRNIVLPAKRWE